MSTPTTWRGSLTRPKSSETRKVSVPLSHFIEWKKVPDDQVDATMGRLGAIGVGDIVAHPEWAKRDPGDGTYLKMVHGAMKKHGVLSSACHGLWGEFDLNCPDEGRRQQIVSAHRRFLRAAAEMGCLTYTVHLGDGHPGQARKSLDQLLPEAERAGMGIAMENMISHDRSLELAALAAEYAHPALGLCLDTGHAHAGEGLKTALENMSPYLFTCHLHDNDGRSDQHFPPGHGTIDWGFLVPAIKACPAIMTAETESGPCGALDMAGIWALFQQAWDCK